MKAAPQPAPAPQPDEVDELVRGHTLDDLRAMLSRLDGRREELRVEFGGFRVLVDQGVITEAELLRNLAYSHGAVARYRAVEAAIVTTAQRAVNIQGAIDRYEAVAVRAQAARRAAMQRSPDLERVRKDFVASAEHVEGAARALAAAMRAHLRAGYTLRDILATNRAFRSLDLGATAFRFACSLAPLFEADPARAGARGEQTLLPLAVNAGGPGVGRPLPDVAGELAGEMINEFLDRKENA